MTPREFKAWFDGFTEAFDKAPTLKQWTRIKERVAEIDGKAVTEKVYVDRYLPYPYRRRYWDDHIVWGSYAVSDATALSTTARSSTTSCAARSFDNISAMSALGKADAAALS